MRLPKLRRSTNTIGSKFMCIYDYYGHHSPRSWSRSFMSVSCWSSEALDGLFAYYYSQVVCTIHYYPYLRPTNQAFTKTTYQSQSMRWLHANSAINKGEQSSCMELMNNSLSHELRGLQIPMSQYNLSQFTIQDRSKPSNTKENREVVCEIMLCDSVRRCRRQWRPDRRARNAHRSVTSCLGRGRSWSCSQ